MDKHEINEEELPEILKELKLENPYLTPPAYFKSLPAEVFHKIREQEAEESKGWRTILSGIFKLEGLRPALSLAMVGLLLLGVYWWNANKAVRGNAALLSDISSQEIEVYLMDNIYEFEESDFYDQEISSVIWVEEGSDPQEIDQLLEGLLEDMDEETLHEIL